ncbi:replication initiator protein [Sigmofec virus UA08Rod_5764]|uniref:Replication initiator protein n=1 Tax=Sigmofec virus UA08Rod_5764 TaxID=2929440 RepID=A0A976N0V7_9VIRU|nr:replication initiator protein [Sigmofec virus UA08Rod_5764]
MACYHPLLRVVLPESDPATGKSLGFIVPFPPSLRPGIDPHVKRHGPVGSKIYVPCGSEQGLPYQVIPCGKCLGCRMEYSRQWANRCLLEAEYHDSIYFVTLTYNDLHVRHSFYPDPATGEAQASLTLCKRDSQLFLKRLRKSRPDDKIRFFMCGEYGPTTWRPHMHFILFGLHLDDLVCVGQRRGNNVYHSLLLERCWSEDLIMTDLFGETCATPLAKDDPLRKIGFVEVMDFSWTAASYVARYILKKQKGPEAHFYQDFNLVPPFTLMSRKPGIGRQWYDDHPDLYDYDYINIKTDTGGKKFRPPKYFNEIFDAQEPEESAAAKLQRQRLSEAAIAAKLSRTDLSYLDYLAVEEDKLKRRTSSLLREEI